MDNEFNWNEHFMELTTKADSGDQHAMNILHNDYFLENDTKQKFTNELINFYKNGYEKKQTYSTMYYGNMHMMGLGIEGNKEIGIKIIQESVDLGCSQGYYLLALIQEAGLCVNNESRSYTELMEEAMKLNNSNAYDIMASDIKDMDPKKAKEYYVRAIELEHTGSMSQLGQMYHDAGKYNLAKKYYKMGMEKNNSSCYFNFAIMYQYGEGYNKNIKKAINYLKKSVDLGNVHAMVTLGAIYINEYEDYDQAIPYLELAVEKDDPLGCYNLGIAYEKIGDREKSLMSYIKGTNLGNEHCMVKLLKI